MIAFAHIDALRVYRQAGNEFKKHQKLRQQIISKSRFKSAFQPVQSLVFIPYICHNS